MCQVPDYQGRLLRACVMIGAVFGATGVLAGALGAHALRGVLGDQELESYETAVRYQLLHAVALLSAGVMSQSGPVLANSWTRWMMKLAAGGFAGGTLLFSGGIYVWLATGARAIVHLVPVGGVVLVLGWLAIVAGAVGFRGGGQGEPHSAHGTPSEME